MTGRELIIELMKNEDINLNHEVALATKDGAFENKEYAMFHVQKVTTKNDGYITLLMFDDIRFKGESE